MNALQQISKFSRVASGFIRLAKASYNPSPLVSVARNHIEKLWDVGCHNDTLTAYEKERCRRCVVALERMIGSR